MRSPFTSKSNSLYSDSTDKEGQDPLLVVRTESKRRSLRSTQALSLLSLVLHTTLIIIHIVLIVIWYHGVEHRLVFSSSLETQKIVSFTTSAIATSFVTIYSAVLVWVTQVLYMRKSLSVKQTLTATHDTSAAWAGIGSSIAHLWSQRTVHASVSSSFDSTQNIIIPTTGIPEFNFSAIPESFLAPNFTGSSKLFPSSILTDTLSRIAGSLYSLPYVPEGRGPSGLYGATLYDVLDPNSSKGNVTVNATSFDISCRYVKDFDLTFDANNSIWETQDKNWIIAPMEDGLLASTSPNGNNIPPGIMLYSTAFIVDSSNAGAFQVELKPSPVDSSDALFAQLIYCTQSLVTQHAVVDAELHELVCTERDLTKTSSVWPSPITLTSLEGEDVQFVQEPWSSPNLTLMNKALLLNNWIPSSDRKRLSNPSGAFFNSESLSNALSFTDVFLNQHLNLNIEPENNAGGPATLYLHDLENNLSLMMASLVWAVGNMPLARWYYRTGDVLADLPTVVRQARGTTTGVSQVTQIRLDVQPMNSIYFFSLYTDHSRPFTVYWTPSSFTAFNFEFFQGSRD
ncbi:hypothetical protein R3P38DRAFT_2837970 [Favolaschia claudopus]|uniref:Uncharacterized protein n=1 Tax=Favolaschia claudopus TaxID=2862362 RepID=A0AAW0E4A9_9AGAR